MRTNKIESIGIISDGLRDLNMFYGHYEIARKNGYNIPVPHPALYVIQKLYINKNRNPAYKREKDINAVKDIMFFLEKSPEMMDILKVVFNNLSKNEKKAVSMTANFNNIFICDEAQEYNNEIQIER